MTKAPTSKIFTTVPSKTSPISGSTAIAFTLLIAASNLSLPTADIETNPSSVMSILAPVVSHERVESVTGSLKEGQKVKVKLIGFDRGKAKLTIKNAEGSQPEKPKKEVQLNEKAVIPKNVTPPPTSKGEKREVAKKWKNKPVSEDENITERKYFN